MIADRERYARGMAAQLAAFEAALADGMPRRGWKVGLNVPEVLAHFGVGHSAVGWLNGRREYRSGATIPYSGGGILHAEPELCLRLAGDVSSRETPDDARGRIASIAPAIELVDYSRPRADLDAIVGHSMFHYGFVVGEWQPTDRAGELGREWPRMASGDGVPVETRPGLVPSHLGAIVAFVAAFLEAFGHSLQAGDLVLSGAYTASAVPLAVGVEARAEFGPLGEVRCRLPG